MIHMRSPARRVAAILSDSVLKVAAPLLVSGRRAASAVMPAPRVLIVRCDHIGDAAMATAVLEPLRKALGPSQLDVLVAPWSAPLFRDHPLVDNVVEFATPWWMAARGSSLRQRLGAWAALPRLVRELRTRRYDIGIDLRGDLRQIVIMLALGGCRERVSSDRTGGRALLTRVWPYEDERHEVEKGLEIVKLLGAVVSDDAQLHPPPPSPLPQPVERALASVGAGGFVVLSTRANLASKSWSTSAAIEFVRQAVAALDVGVVFIGGPADRDVGEAIAAAVPERFVNLAGSCTLTGSLDVLRQARAAVCVDSGPMHLAALVGIPVVALFGPTSPARYAPWTANRVIVQAPGCHCRWSRCELSTDGVSDCLRQIAPEAIVQALSRLLVSTPERPPGILPPLGGPGAKAVLSLPEQAQRAHIRD